MKKHIYNLINKIGFEKTTSRGNKAIRAQTEITSEVFLLILAVSLVGGLAVSLGDVTQGILPGPEGNIGMTQDGTNMTLTIDNLDSNVGNVTVQVASASGTSGTYEFNGSDSQSDVIFDNTGDTPAAGDTMRINVSEGDTITVIAKADNSDRENRIATRTVGPTGA